MRNKINHNKINHNKISHNKRNHNKINIVRIILVIAILFWMYIIFGFSAADAEESQSTSDKITEVIVETMYDGFYDRPQDVQEELWNQVSFVVRKTGHFGEYAILAMLITAFLLTFDLFRENTGYTLLAVLFCAIYAVTDEVHQGFVDGRSPKVMDVCIDTAGAFVSAMICILLWRFISYMRERGIDKR